LTFANRPGRPDVTFAPVGSQCITDWMRALPECPERDAALANVKAAERKRDELMRAKKEAERQAKAREGCIEDMRRNDDEDGAELIRRFFAIEDKDTAKDYDRWST
ncbi:MAG: hypothetical protein GWO24_27595, partial [Akkermansiaceae bacterium]|nr:hypothetical protein [Akkermansiaceae bacterium]